MRPPNRVGDDADVFLDLVGSAVLELLERLLRGVELILEVGGIVGLERLVTEDLVEALGLAAELASAFAGEVGRTGRRRRLVAAGGRVRRVRARSRRLGAVGALV